MPRPGRLCVGHPFNPVYLLPLVEVCGGDRTDPETLERAAALYRGVGMYPLRPAARDRRLRGRPAARGALARGALDGQRRHRQRDRDRRRDQLRRRPPLGQHGNLPDLPDRGRRGRHASLHGAVRPGPRLAVEQAHRRPRAHRRPARSHRRAVRQRRRTDARCASSSACATTASWRWCRGSERRTSAPAPCSPRWERALAERDDAPLLGDGPIDAPLRLYATTVPADWIDYNGHVNDSRYLLAFGEATDALLRGIGIDAAYVAERGSYYTVETHLSHLAAAFCGDPIRVTTQVVGADAKRLQLFHELDARRRRRAARAGRADAAARRRGRRSAQRRRRTRSRRALGRDRAGTRRAATSRARRPRDPAALTAPRRRARSSRRPRTATSATRAPSSSKRPIGRRSAGPHTPTTASGRPSASTTAADTPNSRSSSSPSQVA